ncbi:MAG: cadherin domain-containing protein, partial [Planctomycetota bacterium]
AGLTVHVAAYTTQPAFPHPGSGQAPGSSGQVTPDLALASVRSANYSAMVFIGGWGSSMYQSSAFPGDYVFDHYDGNATVKTTVNQLISEFHAADRHLGFICHAVTVAAWSRVNGTSLVAGRTVSVPHIGSPAVFYNNRFYDSFALGQYEQIAANGGIANTRSGQYGNPATAADDVVVDGRLITAENYDSAAYFGTVIAREVIAAAGPGQSNRVPAAQDTTAAIDEHSPAGTTVVTVAASDPDPGQSLTWRIVSGNTADAFQIHPLTGQITVAAPASVDFETTPVFSLIVEVTDSATQPLSARASVRISLNDRPEVGARMVNGVLHVEGTAAADSIQLWNDAASGQTAVGINGTFHGAFTVPAGGRVVVLAGDGDDVVSAGACRVPVWIFGEAGNDQLTGSAFNDRLDGGPGNDLLLGLGGDDLLFGGTGNDWIEGHAGHDMLIGEAGNDRIEGGTGNDFSIGGSGADYIKGGDGDDLLVTGATVWDRNPEALIDLLSAWNGPGTVSVRAAVVQSGTAAGRRLRSSVEVLADPDQDILCSGTGADLVFVNYNDATWLDELDLFPIGGQ